MVSASLARPLVQILVIAANTSIRVRRPKGVLRRVGTAGFSDTEIPEDRRFRRASSLRGFPMTGLRAQGKRTAPTALGGDAVTAFGRPPSTTTWGRHGQALPPDSHGEVHMGFGLRWAP